MVKTKDPNCKVDMITTFKDGRKEISFKCKRRKNIKMKDIEEAIENVGECLE